MNIVDNASGCFVFLRRRSFRRVPVPQQKLAQGQRWGLGKGRPQPRQSEETESAHKRAQQEV